VGERGRLGMLAGGAEFSLGGAQRVAGAVPAILGDLHVASGALSGAAGVGLGRLCGAAGAGLGLLCGAAGAGLGFVCDPAGVRLGFSSGRPLGRRRSACGDVRSKPNMARLAGQATVTDEGARALVYRRRVERRGHSVKHRLRELVPLRAQKSARRLRKLIDGRALALGGLTQGGRVSAPGKQLRLRALKLIAGFEQGRDRAALRPDELVDRPRGDRWLAEARDLGCLLAPPLTAQRFGKRSAFRYELIEREPVEIVWVG
jgi:hypothetical protein